MYTKELPELMYLLKDGGGYRTNVMVQKLVGDHYITLLRRWVPNSSKASFYELVYMDRETLRWVVEEYTDCDEAREIYYILTEV